MLRPHRDRPAHERTILFRRIGGHLARQGTIARYAGGPVHGVRHQGSRGGRETARRGGLLEQVDAHLRDRRALPGTGNPGGRQARWVPVPGRSAMSSIRLGRIVAWVIGLAASGGAWCSAATSDWLPAGSMNANRAGHTATLLADGRVLVVGGRSGGGSSATAEIFDPTTATWSSAASMSVDRSEHTATLLGDGHVLIAGGFSSATSTHLTSAEIYDPVANTWSAANPMLSGRNDHTATLLGDGKVMVAGGFGFSGTLALAEVYDPVTDHWTAVGSMGTPRDDH